MVLGYDEKRPTADDYKRVRDKLIGGIESLEVDGLSLMLYGSFVRGDYVPGISDIDGVLIFSRRCCY